MSRSQPSEPSEAHDPASPARVPFPPPSLELERLEDATTADASHPGPDEEGEAGGPVAWKAAASSVPRLRQKPAASTDPAAADSFPGFTQDALPSRNPAPSIEREARSLLGVPDEDPLPDAMPLAADLPLWQIWLERVASLPRPVLLATGAALLVVVAATFFLLPRDGAPVSLARLRQQPEAFDGRTVRVRGKAGETFSIGGSYVFSLCQGRDTIVVYSRTRRPSPHQDVQASGTVSIGYLDGVPRVALLEDPATP